MGREGSGQPGQSREGGYGSRSGIDEQVERFIDYLSGLFNPEALEQAALLSQNFWLGV
jgi:hypothetical protein